jgi:hypothetical protein
LITDVRDNLIAATSLYVALQCYFIAGLTIGAEKG